MKLSVTIYFLCFESLARLQVFIHEEQFYVLRKSLLIEIFYANIAKIILICYPSFHSFNVFSIYLIYILSSWSSQELSP